MLEASLNPACMQAFIAVNACAELHFGRLVTPCAAASTVFAADACVRKRRSTALHRCTSSPLSPLPRPRQLHVRRFTSRRAVVAAYCFALTGVGLHGASSAGVCAPRFCCCAAGSFQARGIARLLYRRAVLG